MKVMPQAEKETMESKVKTEQRVDYSKNEHDTLPTNTHRIVSDGLRFKLQIRTARGWPWKREVWEDVGHNTSIDSFIPAYFPTIEATQ